MDSPNFPETVKQLEQWMKDNCYNFDSYSVNGNHIYEGYIIDKSGELFIWYYTERGQRQELEHFASEKEIVQHAYRIIKSDKWANSQYVGLTLNRSMSDELREKLTAMGIPFHADEIPYTATSPAYRTFVFGCDIKKVGHLKDKYYKWPL